MPAKRAAAKHREVGRRSARRWRIRGGEDDGMAAGGGDEGWPRRGCGAAVPIVGERFCRPSEERQLTVQKTSLFFPGDGFAVYEHHHPAEGEELGELVFRVDSYGPSPHLHAIGKRGTRGTAKDDVVLMGPDGGCILTVRRKWPSLHQRWEGFLGERAQGQKPLFSIRRHSIIGRAAGICVEVYGDRLGGGGGGNGEVGRGHRQYRVEGSFSQRCCAVFEVGEDGEEGQPAGGAEAVAEIRRKVVASGPTTTADAGSAADGVVVLGRDVFSLRVAPGFDAAFAMGVVLALDRMTGEDDEREPPWQPLAVAESADVLPAA